MALYPWVAAVCVRMFGGNLKGVQHVGVCHGPCFLITDVHILTTIDMLCVSETMKNLGHSVKQKRHTPVTPSEWARD